MWTLTFIAIGVFALSMGLYAAAEFIARGRPVLPAGDRESRPTVEVTDADPTP